MRGLIHRRTFHSSRCVILRLAEGWPDEWLTIWVAGGGRSSGRRRAPRSGAQARRLTWAAAAN